ncbi:hypothetical protein PF011_g30724 [Phytophthora fragariae]|uniref:Uncharacterized protein n=1 Tax=Phytophthora fragariae TaxID=53985 RepID=A0A6A3GI87_9STRA|nr:hypothetical protein PF011_g30724 [Phytophthora fragariae]
MSSALKIVQPAMLFCSTSFLGIGVDAGMVAAFNLLNACTMRHFPLGLRTQNFGDECGDLDSRTMPAACFAAKKASITSTCSFGSGHCRVVQYSVPGTRSISCLTPRSGGRTEGGSSLTTSDNSFGRA